MKKDIFIIVSVNVLIFVACLAWKAKSLSNELKATKAELAIAQQEIKSITNKDGRNSKNLIPPSKVNPSLAKPPVT